MGEKDEFPCWDISRKINVRQTLEQLINGGILLYRLLAFFKEQLFVVVFFPRSLSGTQQRRYCWKSIILRCDKTGIVCTRESDSKLNAF